MRSAEFGQQVVARLLRAYGEKRRLLIVHIEKCAGTDLQDHLRQSYPVLNAHGIGAHELAPVLRRIASDTIVVAGHVGLEWYLAHELYRFQDRLITVVRHPHQLMLSSANYVVRRIREAPKAPDSVCWLGKLGRDPPAPDAAEAQWRPLALQVLEKITGHNVLCRYLSADGTAAGAFEHLARVDIEISDLDHYEPWLRENWGIAGSRHLNASPPVLRYDDLDRASRRRLHDNSAEDMQLFDCISGAIRASGGNSVMGPQLWPG